MFVDASAFCAVLNNEVERHVFLDALTIAHEIVISPVVVWETVRGTGRHHAITPSDAEARFRQLLGLLVTPDLVMIGESEQRLALDAYARFGKGQHPAKLNMGDCFAYACARAHGLPLLFEGNDFSQTDIEMALKI